MIQRTFWRGLKWLALTLSLGSVIATLILMNLDHSQEHISQSRQSHLPETKVEKPLLIERKSGRIVWQLRAEVAKQQLDGKMHLILPTLQLYNDNGQTMTINSKQAWFEPLTRNVKFQGEVIVDYRNWKLNSATLLYNTAKDMIHVPGQFQLRGGSVQAKGKAMYFFRKTEKVIVTEGIWMKDSAPTWQGEQR